MSFFCFLYLEHKVKNDNCKIDQLILFLVGWIMNNSNETFKEIKLKITAQCGQFRCNMKACNLFIYLAVMKDIH